METFIDPATLAAINAHAARLLDRVAQLAARVPGSHAVARYVRNSYQDDPVRIALELFLCVFALKYLLAKRRDPRGEAKLTVREVDELVDEWEPEPLVPGDDDPAVYAADMAELAKVPVLTTPAGVKVRVAGSNRLLTSLASFDVYGLANSEKIKDKAILALRKYGVGACNPPGFYGTMDVHMQLERDLAAFLGTEAAILYAQGFSAVSSVIPAFSKRGDLVVVDDGVSFALQKGAQISRSRVVFFKHNDMHDLEHKLAAIEAEDRRKREPLYRKFILVEGLYANTGDLCPLPQLVELKTRYKYRLVVDETCSFGVLGTQGRGIAEHYQMPVAESIDILVGSLAHALGSAGGFCAASTPIIEHQRLSAQAYVFSAALPPMLAVAASESLAHIQSVASSVLPTLRSNVRLLRDALAPLAYLELCSAPESPLQHVRVRADRLPFDLVAAAAAHVDDLADSDTGDDVAAAAAVAGPASPRASVLSMMASAVVNSAKPAAPPRPRHTSLRSKKPADPQRAAVAAEDALIQAVVDECLAQGVLVTRAKYNAPQEYNCPRPSLKMIVPGTGELTRRDMEHAAKTIKAAVTKVVAAWAKTARK